MVSYKEKLAQAEAARPFKDVQVCFDEAIVERREELTAALEDARVSAAADERLSTGDDETVVSLREQLDELDASVQDSLVTYRVFRLPGDVWAELVARNPVRVGVPIDQRYGYNYDAVCKQALQFVGADGFVYGGPLEDDAVTALDAAEWARTFKVLSGHEVTKLISDVWELNEYEKSQRIEALVKSFGAASRSATK